MPDPIIDLRSDTVTRPTPAMREAMARADVGDDVYGEDPTVNQLEARAAALFGKEAGLFVPSGTMANLVAILAQTRPGDAAIMAAGAHPNLYESGNLAMVGGLMLRLLEPHDGLLTADAVRDAIDPATDHHHTPTTLVTIENTFNTGGGVAYPLGVVADIARVAHGAGLKLHCDGARIFNALIAESISPADFGSHVDTLSFCLSKGLGAPAGSLVVGDRETIHRAHRFRKMLGGGMRQAGILAAAGLYALDYHIERFADDHLRARQFREALEPLPGISFPKPSPTNLVYFEAEDAPRVVDELAARGVLIGRAGYGTSNLLRAVFHLDIDDRGLERSITAIQEVVGKR